MEHVAGRYFGSVEEVQGIGERRFEEIDSCAYHESLRFHDCPKCCPVGLPNYGGHTIDFTLCDEVVVAVGRSDDATLEVIRSIDPTKIRIIETVWDDTQREGGRVLALETDKAFAAISADADWCFYIQADEVLHEKYYPAVRDAMQKHLNDPEVEGLLFHYLHFYGSYDYIGSSWSWYRREIRIIRNNKRIFSYRDAQGFRKHPNEKPRFVSSML